MCTVYFVDEATKQKIAAYSARFREVSASPFGSDEQIGMLNLIEPESRAAISSRADAGKVFDLAVDHFVGMPGWLAANDPSFQILMTHTPRGEEIADVMAVGADANRLVSYSGDAVSMYTHTGTHVDSLNHFGYHGRIFNQFSAQDHLGSSLSAPDTCQCPPAGHRARVAALRRRPACPGDAAAKDRAGRLGGLPQVPGHEAPPRRRGAGQDGAHARLPDPGAYMTDPPGLNRAGAEFLAKGSAITIGADNHCVEEAPSADPENWQVVHTYLLAEAGIPMMEIVDLEELAAERVYEYAFFGACIKLRGATGSPMRPVAMPLRKRARDHG